MLLESERLINVLNHGFVRLVDYMGSDIDVVRAARVSYNADWRTGEDSGKDAKLIHYLLSNKHTSPFESVVFTFEIKCPIFVLRQWGRHRTQDYNDGEGGIGYEKYWAYNEVSARYVELPEEFYVPEANRITTQSKDNKQMRTDEVHPDCEWIRGQLQLNHKEAFRIYHDLIRIGCPRELARTVLPFATYTRLFATVNLHNLLLWISLRLHPHAQYEIRVYAEAVKKLISSIVPVTMDAFDGLQS